jgi:peptidoglycan-associated lipoprotein
MLGALGARGAYAQGDNNMGGTSPPDQEQLPEQQQETPLPDQAPDQSMRSDTDTSDQAQATTEDTDQAKSQDQTKSADQAKGTEKAKGTAQAKTEPMQQETITDQNGKTVLTADVNFAFDSSQLGADANAQLQPIADWAKCNPKSAVIIEGHADPRGSVDYNQKLSAQRAAQVRERLVQLGVPSARIVMSVYGEQGPRRPTFAEDRRAVVRPALTPVEAREVTAQR